VYQQTKPPFVDHFQHWSKALTADKVDIEQWLTDHSHPNPRGHEEIASLMKSTVVKLIRAK
jgi:lysophospholipase L1-like esterase